MTHHFHRRHTDGLAGQLLRSFGQFLVIFFSGIAVYKGFSELTPDALYQPLIQGVLGALAILGFSRINGFSRTGRGREKE